MVEMGARDRGAAARRGGARLCGGRDAAARPCRRDGADRAGRSAFRGGDGSGGDNYPRWRSGLERIELSSRGPEGTRFVEHSGGDAIAFLLVEEVRDERFRSTITDPNLPFGGYWTIALEPANRGTRVRIEEHGFVTSPVYRFFARFLFGHESTMRTWLDDLERAVSPR